MKRRTSANSLRSSGLTLEREGRGVAVSEPNGGRTNTRKNAKSLAIIRWLMLRKFAIKFRKPFPVAIEREIRQLTANGTAITTN